MTVEAVAEVADPEQSRRRMGWRTRIVVALVAVWLLFLGLDLLLAHGPWMWAYTDMMPPPAFLVMPILLGALSFLAVWPVRTWLLVTVVVQLVLGFGPSGINPSALWNSETPIPANAIKVVSWNTEYWEQEDDPERFYQFIKGFDADVYLLQEYIYLRGGANLETIDRRDRVEREFPGYRMIVKGELVTLTRLPVVNTPWINAREVLRVDVDAGDAVISTYNVHLPVHVFMQNPFRAETTRAVRARVGIRNARLDSLVGDVGANPRSSVIAGDFNHSRTQDDITRLSTVATDALAENQSLYPASWNAERWWLHMWRLDLAFTSRKASTVRYDFRDPQRLSDHSVQELVIAP